MLGKNKTLLKEKFKQYTTLNDDVGAIYAASEDKKLYKYPDSGVPKGFDPTGRDWYKQAVAEKDKLFSQNRIPMKRQEISLSQFQNN